MPLYPYQISADLEIDTNIQLGYRTILVMPTGAGKQIDCMGMAKAGRIDSCKLAPDRPKKKGNRNEKSGSEVECCHNCQTDWGA